MNPLIASVLALVLLVACSDDGASPADGGADVSADRLGDTPAVDGGSDQLADGSDDGSDASAGGITDGSPPEIPPTALLEMAPAVQDFGSVAKDAIVTRFFVVKNAGGQMSGALDIKLMNGALDPDAFAIVSNGCDSSLEPAATCEIEVRFFANVPGAHQGLLTADAAPGGMASADIKATVP